MFTILWVTYTISIRDTVLYLDKNNIDKHERTAQIKDHFLMTWELTMSFVHFIWNFLSQNSLMHGMCVCVCVCIDCTSCYGFELHTLSRLFMQVVKCVLSITPCTEPQRKINQNKEGKRKHWYQDNGHNSFRSCRKIEKTLYFLIFFLPVSGYKFSLLFGLNYLNLYEELIFNSIEIKKRDTIHSNIHYVISECIFHSNIIEFYSFFCFHLNKTRKYVKYCCFNLMSYLSI